jgi:hypothetical protein
MAHDGSPHGRGDKLLHANSGPQRGEPVDQSAGRKALGSAQMGGAAISMALMVGLAVWGYRLMERDASGVPMIPSTSEDARLVPEDPGGQLAMHQGLAVNSVTADGSAQAPADRLVLAPPAFELADEDQPMKIAVETAAQTTPVPVPNLGADVTVEASGEPLTAEPVDGALEQELAVSEAPSQDDAESLEDLEVATVIEVPAGGVGMSPRPQVRPASFAALHASVPAAESTEGLQDLTATAAPTVEPEENELKPADIPVGTRLVQFGAYNSAAVARQEWDRLSAKFDEFMTGKTRVIEVAQSGGRTFYRLRAHGFSDAAESARFCAALTSRDADCIPARQR